MNRIGLILIVCLLLAIGFYERFAYAQTVGGGANQYSEIVPANTTGVLVAAGNRAIVSLQLGGIGSTPVYLKFYDTATAPTCGTGTPTKRLLIPAAATAANGAGSNIVPFGGIKFISGIGFCVTGAITDADTTAPAANTYLINFDWD